MRTGRPFAAALALALVAVAALPAFAEEKTIKGMAMIFEDLDDPKKKVFTVTVETADGSIEEYTVLTSQEKMAEVEKAMVEAKSEEVEVTGEVGADREGRPTIALKSFKVVKQD